MNELKLILTFVSIILLLSGCGSPSVKLTGQYVLERFDDGPAYFVDDSHYTGYEEGGVFRGDIMQLGMNDKWMLAQVAKSVYNTDADHYGWYALSLRSGKVFGPLDEQELAKNQDWNNIQLKNPATFFTLKGN